MKCQGIAKVTVIYTLWTMVHLSVQIFKANHPKLFRYFSLHHSGEMTVSLTLPLVDPCCLYGKQGFLIFRMSKLPSINLKRYGQIEANW